MVNWSSSCSIIDRKVRPFIETALTDRATFAAKAGDVVARMDSTEVLSTIAQLSQNAALIDANRQATLKRQAIVGSLIPVARRLLDPNPTMRA